MDKKNHYCEIGFGRFLQVWGWVKGESRGLKSKERDAEWMAQKRNQQRMVKQGDDEGGGQDSWMEMMKN